MSIPTSLDPVDEHQTSAVFQPFPSSLLQRLNPSPPQPYLSPLPSESDISQSRYSDAASTTTTTSTSDHRRFALWHQRQVDFPSPPTPLHQDRLQPDNLDHAHLSHSTPLFIHRPARQTPLPKPRPIEHDDTPSPIRGIGRAVWRLFSRRRRSRPDPVATASRSTTNEMAHADRSQSAQGNHERSVPRGLRHDTLSAMRLRVEKDNDPISSAPGSEHRLRGRGKGREKEREKERGRGRRRKVRTDLGLPDVVTPSVGAGRHMGRGDVRRNMVWKESNSMGNLSGSLNRKERDRAGVYGEKEATSFGGYRRIVKFGEGSSVSSCEDRDEEAEANHLYLSRRQLRAMQYK